MNWFPIEYEAKIWNEIEETIEIVHGVTFGTSFSDGMDMIEKYYGDTIIEIDLFMNEECSVYEFEATQGKVTHGKYRINFEEWTEE